MTTPASSPSHGGAPGFIIAAPASGSGKTIVTLALLRAFARADVKVASAKVGPDYIDPAYHRAASGAPCVNLDSWAMQTDTFSNLVHHVSANADLVICEGVMGLFDGALLQSESGNGSTADAAARTGWPVVLVVDARGQAQSAGALIEGFVRHRRDINVAGVIFNRVGSDRHAETLRAAAEQSGVAVLGCLPRDPALALPERHLGLVQAGEHDSLEVFLDNAARIAATALDLDALQKLAQPTRLRAPLRDLIAGPPPLGQTIAIARDDAFAFTYPAVLDQWRAQGAALHFFSPLSDEAPGADVDAVYLPGGYPELHAGRLAGNDKFISGVRNAATRGAKIYGECGGYMILGDALTDGDGHTHRMTGLLPLRTSFAAPKLHLGYRRAETLTATPLGAARTTFTGHEFHYAAITEEGPGQALFRIADAAGAARGDTGLTVGAVAGSFIHLIDQTPAS
jgi:cobyrinic acid a,c-diamide synthase